MKPVKKFVRVLAVALILCMMMATAVSAAEAGKVWLSVTQSASGEGTVALVITDTTVTDGLIKITYDSEKLTYQDVLVSSEYVAMHAVNAENPGEILISWVAPEAYEADGSAITLIEVRFEGADDALELTGAAHDAEGNLIAIGSVDTSALEEAVEDAKALKEEDYTAESWAALEEALEEAEDTLKDPTSTQEEVDAATENLKEAMDALEEKSEDPTTVPSEPEEPSSAPEEGVDTTELEKAIKKAESLKEKDYTPKSYKAMEAALKVAKSVLADEDATQEEVDAAADALNKAIKALVPSTGKNPGTGDDSQLVLVAAIGALALVGIIALAVIAGKNKKNGRYAK